MRRIPVLVLAAFLLTVAGCSSATPGQGGPTPVPTGPPTASSGVTTAPAQPADFCSSVEATIEPGNELAGYYNGVPASDAEIDETANELRTATAGVATTAPPEIAEDVSTVNGLLTTVLDSLQSSHDPQATLRDPAVLFAFAGAGGAPGRVSAYAEAECGVQLNFLPGG